MLTVLVILAAVVSVAIPYASRSNEHLLLEGECRNMAETIAYATDLAARSRREVRFVVDLAAKAYSLEIAEDRGVAEYAVVEDGRRMMFRLSEKMQVYDVEGFDPSGNARYVLVFSPYKPWPSATLSLAAVNEVRRIEIAGRRVSVEDVPE